VCAASQAYERLPDHYWYYFQYDPTGLRWEYLPPPPARPTTPLPGTPSPHGGGPSGRGGWPQRAQQAQQERDRALPATPVRMKGAGAEAGGTRARGVAAAGAGTAGAAAGRQGPPVMWDVFAGLGTVSYAAKQSGFEVGMELCGARI
jgi:hypothetical protein